MFNNANQIIHIDENKKIGYPIGLFCRYFYIWVSDDHKVSRGVFKFVYEIYANGIKMWLWFIKMFYFGVKVVSFNNTYTITNT